MFQVELVFPPDFPDAPPYVHFLTSMFHPHISPLGVPYLRHLIMWNHLEPKEKSVSSLLTVLEPGQTRRPGSGRAGHLRLSKRPHACSRRPSVLQRRRAVEQSLGRLGPAAQPRSRTEPPLDTRAPLRSDHAGARRAAGVESVARARDAPQPRGGVPGLLEE